MTLEESIRQTKRILAANRKGTGRLEAIRWLRALGLGFRTARAMVDEITAGAPWYRRY